MEERPAPWALKGLWSQNEPVKCRVKLADTILLRGPEPIWLFSGRKHGEIRKRKASNCNGKEVQRRFKQIAQAHDDDMCVVFRYASSSIVKVGDMADGKGDEGVGKNKIEKGDVL